jgi:hypothetical protein
MTDFSKTTLRRVSALLHDARVQDVAWDQNLATLRLRFDCLRRKVDGSQLDDKTVEFNLTGVQALAVCYDSGDGATRPSQFKLARKITSNDLAEWSFRLQEASLGINSGANYAALESSILVWHLGDTSVFVASNCTFNLMFDQWGDFGLPMLDICLLAGGDTFAISSSGVPLEIDEWEQQYAAWCKGWKKYWDEKKVDASDEVGEYEGAFPIGKSEEPDLSYQPPAEPIFDLDPSEAPPELIGCLRQFFESRHHRDWKHLAEVYPNSNLSTEERAEQLEGWELSHHFGSWGYPRSIDEWWLEGVRACVVLRGIEHQMGFEDVPAENRETVWTFFMRNRSGKWITLGYSQGWPRHKSAKQLASEQKTWLKKWKSGIIK